MQCMIEMINLIASYANFVNLILKSFCEKLTKFHAKILSDGSYQSLKINEKIFPFLIQRYVLQFGSDILTQQL